MITGTCGHELKDDGNALAVKEFYNSYGEKRIEKCICYVRVCDECAKEYEKSGIVIHNEQEEREWLNEH